MATQLRRHDLVWLSRAGWQHLLADDREPEVLQCLEHWCEERLPLVVGRQEPGRADLALGLAAPIAWGRRKIALWAPRSAVLYHDLFPRAAQVARLLPVALRARWAGLNTALAALDVDARVHGSHGWQRLTGLAHLLPGSDMDLLLPVSGPQVADHLMD